MGVLISKTQSGFIEDRGISDSIITANTAVNWLKKKRKAGALLKLDFRKAYDSIKWSFLDHMLLQMGFGRKMIQWL